MIPRAWCVCTAFAATACSFDLADVVTDAPGDDGGAFDGAPGDETGLDAAALDGATEASAADAPRADVVTDAPSDADAAVPPDTGVDGGPTRVTNGLVVL